MNGSESLAIDRPLVDGADPRARPDAGTEAASRVALGDLSIPAGISWIMSSALLVNVVQVMREGGDAGRLSQGLVVGLTALLGAASLALVALHRRTILDTLTNLRFGAGLLICIAGATGSGVLVLQTGNEELFHARYGRLTSAMTWLHLDDLFHSAWFAWLFFLLGLSLVSLIVRGREWRLKRIGFGLTHGGLALVLLGGVLGSWLGVKGMVHLKTGEADAHALTGTGLSVELPFRIRLEEFSLERMASRISVAGQGPAVAEGELSVNRPLEHEGYWLYQGNYDPKDPSYSGILVVRDPGLRVVMAGLILGALGILHLMVSAWLRHGRGRAGVKP